MARATGDAAVGGAISAATGGSFKDGFISAGISSGLAPGVDAIKGLNSTVVSRTLAAAVIGGTASSLTGGKFANGAITSAFVHLVNHEIADSLANLNIIKTLKARRAGYDAAKIGNMPLHKSELYEIMEAQYYYDSANRKKDGTFESLVSADSPFRLVLHPGAADNRGMFSRSVSAGRKIPPGFRGSGYTLVPNDSLNFYPVDGLVGNNYFNWEINYYAVGMRAQMIGAPRCVSKVGFDAYVRINSAGARGSQGRFDFYVAGFEYAYRMSQGWKVPSKPKAFRK
jgi:hypothetical protein